MNYVFQKEEKEKLQREKTNVLGMRKQKSKKFTQTTKVYCESDSSSTESDDSEMEIHKEFILQKYFHPVELFMIENSLNSFDDDAYQFLKAG